MRIKDGIAHMLTSEYTDLKNRKMLVESGGEELVLLHGYTNKINLIDQCEGYRIVATEIHHTNKYSSYVYVVSEWTATKEGGETLNGQVMGLEFEAVESAAKTIKSLVSDQK